MHAMIRPRHAAWHVRAATAVVGATLAVSTAFAQGSAPDPLDDFANSQAAAAGPQPDPRFERARQLVDQGVRFESGIGMARDYGKALQLYCAAARADFAEGLMRLGWMYYNGQGVVRSEAIGVTLFRKASKLGSDMARGLTEMFHTSSEHLPPCLGGTELAVEPPAPAPNDAALRLATPKFDKPAEFKETPPPLERRRVVEMIVKLARQFRIDPRLVLALINTESNFDAGARSVKNAQGLMQLIPDTAERFAVKDAFDPAENLRGGMAYLRCLLAYYQGDVVLAIAAYNAGEGAVDKYKGVPPFAETLAYVQRIRTLYPVDFHPFDASATSASMILRVGRDASPVQPARTPTRG